MSGDEVPEEAIRLARLDLVLLSRPLMDAIVAGDGRVAQALAGFVPTGKIVDGEPIFELHCTPGCGHRFGAET